MTVDEKSSLPENLAPGELLRRAMRRWPTGVAVVTSFAAGVSHGMTVNSFGSISLDPPLVTVTMHNDTRTCGMLRQSGVFAVTILSREQQHLAELFAGRIPEEGDRMTGLETFALSSGALFLQGGAAFVDCHVVHQYAMQQSTLFIAEVLTTQVAAPERAPLVYFNRSFTGLE